MTEASYAKTHENMSPDWWTPPEWIDWVDETMGDWWHDPCPSDWQEGDPSGLEIDWAANVYCNHPGAKRGSAARWWRKAMDEQCEKLIWCAFNIEQVRHCYPSQFDIPGWLVMPRTRTSFIWGGPTGWNGTSRVHGEPGKSPGNWSVWWTNIEPAKPPKECIIHRTG